MTPDIVRRSKEPHLSPALPITVVQAADELAQTLDQMTDAVIWQRAVPAAVRDALDGLAPERLPEGRYVLAPDLVAECVAAVFDAHGITDTPALTWLRQDIENLARRVSAWFGAPQVRLRLEPVFDNACAKMHIDHVEARLICTYRGPGTQLGLDTSGQTALTEIPTGMPVLLKGTLWPGGQKPRLRHRSPPISDTGLARWVVVLEACRQRDRLPEYDRPYHGGSLTR